MDLCLGKSVKKLPHDHTLGRPCICSAAADCAQSLVVPRCGLRRTRMSYSQCQRLVRSMPYWNLRAWSTSCRWPPFSQPISPRRSTNMTRCRSARSKVRIWIPLLISLVVTGLCVLDILVSVCGKSSLDLLMFLRLLRATDVLYHVDERDWVDHFG